MASSRAAPGVRSRAGDVLDFRYGGAGVRPDSPNDANRNDEHMAPPFGTMPFLTRRESSFRLDSHSSTVSSTADLTAEVGLAEDESAAMTMVKQKRSNVQSSDRYGMGITYTSGSPRASVEDFGTGGGTPGRRGSASSFGNEVDRLMEEQRRAAFGSATDAAGAGGAKRRSFASEGI